MPENDVLFQMKTVLNTTAPRWMNLAQTLPADLLTQTPAPGEWSALECLQHIVDVEKVFQFRLQCFLAGQDFPAFNPDSEGTQGTGSPSPEAVAAEFARLRAESLQALAVVTPDDLQRRQRHQELGMVSLEEMLHEWAAHDLNHTIQAERALMQPFIDGCGPWQKYFTDHMIRKE